MNRKIRAGLAAGLVVALAATALLAASCGDDEKSSEAAEQTAGQTVTAAQAIGEIGQVRNGLADALAAYQAGDAERADQLVGDAYLEHFELVEGPLGEADGELTEELEELIREQLRAQIQEGVPVAKVASLVAEANQRLSEAERVLIQVTLDDPNQTPDSAAPSESEGGAY